MLVFFLHTVRAPASLGYIRYFSNDELLAPLAVLPVTCCKFTYNFDESKVSLMVLNCRILGSLKNMI